MYQSQKKDVWAEHILMHIMKRMQQTAYLFVPQYKMESAFSVWYGGPPTFTYSFFERLGDYFPLYFDLGLRTWTWTWKFLFLKILPEELSYRFFLQIFPEYISWRFFLNIFPEDFSYRLFQEIFTKVFSWKIFLKIFFEDFSWRFFCLMNPLLGL